MISFNAHDLDDLQIRQEKSMMNSFQDAMHKRADSSGVQTASTPGGFTRAIVETDPHGKPPSAPGSKLDAGKNQLGLVLGGFALALEQVGEVGTFGAHKYTPNGWMSVPNGIERYTDAMYRHLLSEAQGETADPQTKLLHAAHTAWNALARLDLLIRHAKS